MTVVTDQKDRLQRSKLFENYARDSSNEQKGKVYDESRITAIGKFMRRHSIDELPQLWNVLKGNMSLIGPRPCLNYEAELFPKWAERRFLIRSGITGLWQIYGRGTTNFQNGLLIDVYHVYSQSFWYYPFLIWKTGIAVIKGTGDK